MAGSVKNSHPHGVHPNVVADVFDIHLRSVFRHFKKKRLKKVSAGSMLADKEHVLELLAAKLASCSHKEARRRLHVTQGTIVLWRVCKVLETVRVLSEERIKLASVMAVLSMPNYKLKRKRRLFNTGLDEDAQCKVKFQVWDKADELSEDIEAKALVQAKRKLDLAEKKFRAEERRLRNSAA